MLRGDYAGANAIDFAANASANIASVTLVSASDTTFATGGTDFDYDLTFDDPCSSPPARR